MKATVGLTILLSALSVPESRAETLVIGSDGATAGTAAIDVPVGSYIRSDSPAEPRSNRFMLVGELNADRGSMRGILSFDLSAVPPGATVTSASVSLFQDRATAGRGASRTVDIQLCAMTGSVTPAANWNNTAGLFGTVLASAAGNTRNVALNHEFVFSSAALAGWVETSRASRRLDLGVMVPGLEALTGLPSGEYFIFDGPDGTGYAGSTDAIGPSLTLEYQPAGGNGTSPDGGVIINEIHSDPDLPYELVEFIELYNSNDESIDLSGWYFSKGVDYTFPPGTTIAPGQFIVVTEDATARTVSPTTNVHLKFGTGSALILGTFTGGLDNDGETIELRDAAGVEVDQVDYQLGFPWPTVGGGPPGGGSSMQLVNAGLDNDLGGSWRSAFPTPGANNAAVYMANPPPQIRQVKHSPGQPLSTDSVTVSAKATDADTVASVELLYQVVRPGSYVRLGDPEYDNWVATPMSDDGSGGDAIAGDSVFSARLPAEALAHRNLIRYRIRAVDASLNGVTVPYADDPQPNFALMVYDGVPAWSGVSDPGAGDPATQFPADVMRSLPAYHLIAVESDVTSCQYSPSSSATRFYGTLVYDGEVYDHIQFRVRGEFSTYVSGKNKWKFFFTRGHGFEPRDDYGKKYEEPWRVMSVSACAAPYNANLRGSSGIDEALAFRLFNMAGVPAPRTHYFQLRVIDSAGENSFLSQYVGDLWGLYLSTEFPDGRFLKEHGLPDGNTYKMEGGVGDKKHQGATQPVSRADLSTFQAGFNATQTAGWWEANFDLEAYFAFRAVNHIVNNLDLADVRNFYWYHNSETDRWMAIPWDMDNAYLHADSEHVRLTVHRCLDLPEIKLAYDNYVRELQDLLFTREQTSLLVDELASVIHPPGLPNTMVDVDEHMWNYHPRAGTIAGRTHRGAFFLNPAFRTTQRTPRYGRWLVTADFEGMMHFYKDFVAPRAGSVTEHDSTWAYWNGRDRLDASVSDSGIPETPSVEFTGGEGYPVDDLAFRTSPFRDPTGVFAAMKWRIGEVEPSSPPAVGIGGGASSYVERGKYEIAAVWESPELTTFAADILIPDEQLTVGSTYRVRCKMKDSTGRWSHWSAPVEFLAGAADVTAWRENLVVSEFMYHPPAPAGAELDVSTDPDDFEYIELWNRSETASLNLTGLSFTDGVGFSFAEGSIATLAPRAYVLVVKSVPAFEARYGAALPVAGAFSSGNLSNGGEQVTLSFTGGTVIREWTYNDSSPWPPAADGLGPALVLKAPGSVPDHAEAASWTAGVLGGGTPGAEETVAAGSFEAWRLNTFTPAQLADEAISGPDADPDGDQLPNQWEWALATDAFAAGGGPQLEFAWVKVGGEEYPAIRFHRPEGAPGVVYELMVSGDLENWQTVDRAPVSEGSLGRGVEQALLRAETPLGDGERQRFLRVRIRLQN